MKNLSKFIPIFLLTAFVPIIVFAAGPCDALDGVGKVICQIGQIIKSIVPVLVSLGVVYFIWGVIKYVIADGEEAKKKGKDTMIYGIIGFTVISGLWGLVNILIDTFGLGGISAITPTNACVLGPNPNFSGLLNYITCMINGSVIPLIFTLAIAMFIWGVINFFIINADEEAKRAQGRQFMIWGIIALTVMLCVWGLVNILGVTFGVDSKVLPKVCPPNDPACSR